jgi:hypothetical protein
VVAQTLENRITSSGRLVVIRMGPSAYGVFQWAGHGNVSLKGSIRPDGIGEHLIYLDGPLPTTIYTNPTGEIQMAHYRATVTTSSSFYAGTVFWGNATAANSTSIGTWTGYSRTCDYNDRKLIHAQFGI